MAYAGPGPGPAGRAADPLYRDPAQRFYAEVSFVAGFRTEALVEFAHWSNFATALARKEALTAYGVHL